MTTDTKPSNPKDIIGSTKLPLELVPDTAVAYMALAFLEGALKYGRYNWRIAGVRSSIYRAAMHRHMMKWWNGEDSDPKTGVPHLASIMACCGIILDADEALMLEDDRPPALNMGRLVDELAVDVECLTAMFADHSPYQWTIADTEGAGDAWEPEDAPQANEALRALVRRKAPWDVAADPTDAAYEAAEWKPEIGAIIPIDVARPSLADWVFHGKTTTYSASPAAGVTLGPYSSQEALDKALYRWTEYREILGETEGQRQARLRREQEQ